MVSSSWGMVSSLWGMVSLLWRMASSLLNRAWSYRKVPLHLPQQDSRRRGWCATSSPAEGSNSDKLGQEAPSTNLSQN